MHPWEDGTQRLHRVGSRRDPAVFLSVPVEETLPAVTKFKMLGKAWR